MENLLIAVLGLVVSGSMLCAVMWRRAFGPVLDARETAMLAIGAVLVLAVAGVLVLGVALQETQPEWRAAR